jgi:hypothetical protein
MSDVGDAAQIVAAVFTAGAAGAAWRTVGQGQRLWRHGVEPDLHIQVLLNASTGTADMAIFNIGGGTARGVFFAMAAGGQRTTGVIEDGIMAGGSKYFVHAALPRTDDAEGIVWWRNIDESSWAIDRVGPKRRLRRAVKSRRARRRAKGRSIEEVWRLFFPNRPIDGLPEVTHQITKT